MPGEMYRYLETLKWSVFLKIS